MPNQLVDIYTDHLGLSECATITRYALTHPVNNVHYRTSTPFCLSLTRLIRLIRQGLVVEQRGWDQTTPHSAGSTVYHHLQRVSLAVADTIADKLERTGSFVDRLPFDIAANRRRSFLRTQIVGDIYWPLLQGMIATAEGQNSPQAVLMSAGGLAREVNAATREHLPNVRFIGVSQLRDGFAFRTAWFFAAQAKRALARLMAGFEPYSVKPHARIGIAHSWGQIGQGNRQEGDLGMPRDVWWYQASGLAPERCTIIFGRSKLTFAAADASARWLESHDFDIATSSQSPHLDLGARRIDSTPGLIRTLRDTISYGNAALLAIKSPAGSWQAAMYLRTAYHVRTWQTIFARENIKVWFDASDSSMDLSALACDSVGAIKLGLFWSSEVLPTSRSSAAHAVRFVPGPAAYHAYLRGPGGTDVVVEVGNNYQSTADTERSRVVGGNLRDTLGGKNVYVIVALDRSSSESSIVPPAKLRDFYEHLVSHTESDSTIRLVIKPKSPLSETPGMDTSLMMRIADLEAAERVRVLDDQRSVMDAAYAADIVVGLGVSSAGFLTVAAGIPTIFADPSLGIGGPDGDLLRRVGWESSSTVFPDTRAALAAITRSRVATAGVSHESKLGDLSAYLGEIDPYHDGNSAVRVGEFLRSFIEEIDDYQPVSQALDAAAQAYATTHGSTHIHILGTPNDP